MNRLTNLIIVLCLIATAANAQRNGYRGYRNNDETHFRLGLHGGWSYRTARISGSVPADFRSYINGLKSGYHYGGNAMYFFSDMIGVGVEYSASRSKNEMTVQDTSGRVGIMRDDISISFIGPSVSRRYVLGADGNFHILMTLSVGYLSYKNNAVLFDNYTLKSGTAGLGVGLSFDYALHPGIYLGAAASFLGGSLSYFDYADAQSSRRIELGDEQRENISRVDVSAGIRFNF